MNAMPARMTNFCHRMISKRNIDDVGNIQHLSSIVLCLEGLDTQLNCMMSTMIGSPCSGKHPEIACAMQELSRIYSEFYSCYFDFDLAKIVALINRRNIMAENVNSLFALAKDETLLLLCLNNSLIHMNSMMVAALLIEV